MHVMDDATDPPYTSQEIRPHYISSGVNCYDTPGRRFPTVSKMIIMTVVSAVAGISIVLLTGYRFLQRGVFFSPAHKEIS